MSLFFEHAVLFQPKRSASTMLLEDEDKEEVKGIEIKDEHEKKFINEQQLLSNTIELCPHSFISDNDNDNDNYKNNSKNDMIANTAMATSTVTLTTATIIDDDEEDALFGTRSTRNDNNSYNTSSNCIPRKKMRHEEIPYLENEVVQHQRNAEAAAEAEANTERIFFDTNTLAPIITPNNEFLYSKMTTFWMNMMMEQTTTERTTSQHSNVVCENDNEDVQDQLASKVAVLQKFQNQFNTWIEKQMEETKRAMIHAALMATKDDTWMMITNYLNDKDLLHLQMATCHFIPFFKSPCKNTITDGKNTIAVNSNNNHHNNNMNRNLCCWTNPDRHLESYSTSLQNETTQTRKQRAIRLREISEYARRFEQAGKKHYNNNNNNHNTEPTQEEKNTDWPNHFYTKRDFCRDFEPFHEANFRQQQQLQRQRRQQQQQRQQRTNEENENNNDNHGQVPMPNKEFFVRVTYQHDDGTESVLLEGFRHPSTTELHSSDDDMDDENAMMMLGSNSHMTMGSFGNNNDDNDHDHSPYIAMRFPNVSSYDATMIGLACDNNDQNNNENDAGGPNQNTTTTTYRRPTFLQQWPEPARRDFLNRITITILACPLVHDQHLDGPNTTTSTSTSTSTTSNDISTLPPPELVVTTTGYHDWDFDIALLQPRPKDATDKSNPDIDDDCINVGFFTNPHNKGFGILIQWGLYDW